jgi:hypothetical protein
MSSKYAFSIFRTFTSAGRANGPDGGGVGFLAMLGTKTLTLFSKRVLCTLSASQEM